jgi:hypothetical protein
MVPNSHYQAILGQQYELDTMRHNYLGITRFIQQLELGEMLPGWMGPHEENLDVNNLFKLDVNKVGENASQTWKYLKGTSVGHSC